MVKIILIVIGCDATGKDTLIEELHKRTGYDVRRGSSFQMTHGKNEDELFDSFLELTKQDNTILNRYMYCNYIYANLYSDYARIRESDMRFIERELKGEALVIHLHADEEVIKSRFRSRGEDYVDEGKIKTILELYENVIKDCTLDVLSFDTGILNTYEIADTIMEFVGEVK